MTTSPRMNPDTDTYEITDGAYDLIRTLGEGFTGYLLDFGGVIVDQPLEITQAVLSPTAVTLTVKVDGRNLRMSFAYQTVLTVRAH